MKYFVCGDPAAGEYDGNARESSAPADSSAMFQLKPLFCLRPKIKKLPKARGTVCHVIPSRIPYRARPVRQFPQYLCAGTTLSFRVREFTENRLLNNILELIEYLIGRVVLHRPKTLWHRMLTWTRLTQFVSRLKLA
jgi:hypothetical protein